jgi:hypothetical protein
MAFQRLLVKPRCLYSGRYNEYVSKYSAPNAMRAAFQYYRAFPVDVEQNRELAKERIISLY